MIAVTNKRIQLAVIGAGPAGLAAASTAAQFGVEVMLIDDQKQAGGQIYRNISTPIPAAEKIFGAHYHHGNTLLKSVHNYSIKKITEATVWYVTPEKEIYFTRKGVSDFVRADYVVLACGALERPMPMPGWTLPGVMTIGAAQILLKSHALMPVRSTILAGSGPLMLLLAAQYLRAGIRVDAIVDTTPGGNFLKALPYLPAAFRASDYLQEGIGLMWAILKNRIPWYRAASRLRAHGNNQIDALQFFQGSKHHELPCKALLLHQGVVPNVQITRSLGLKHLWNDKQRYWYPRLNPHGETELDGIYIAGDGGSIYGAMAAEHQGGIIGLNIAIKIGVIAPADAQRKIALERQKMSRHLAIRPFLDMLFSPSKAFLTPGDETIVCRCEEVTAGQIRDCVKIGCLGPNQIKSFSRAGMGPCQGRYCGLTVSEIIADTRKSAPTDIGYFRIRPPIKPVTLGEMASLIIEKSAGSA